MGTYYSPLETTAQTYFRRHNPDTYRSRRRKWRTNSRYTNNTNAFSQVPPTAISNKEFRELLSELFLARRNGIDTEPPWTREESLLQMQDDLNDVARQNLGGHGSDWFERSDANTSDDENGPFVGGRFIRPGSLPRRRTYIPRSRASIIAQQAKSEVQSTIDQISARAKANFDEIVESLPDCITDSGFSSVPDFADRVYEGLEWATQSEHIHSGELSTHGRQFRFIGDIERATRDTVLAAADSWAQLKTRYNNRLTPQAQRELHLSLVESLQGDIDTFREDAFEKLSRIDAPSPAGDLGGTDGNEIKKQAFDAVDELSEQVCWSLRGIAESDEYQESSRGWFNSRRMKNSVRSALERRGLPATPDRSTEMTNVGRRITKVLQAASIASTNIRNYYRDKLSARDLQEIVDYREEEASKDLSYAKDKLFRV